MHPDKLRLAISKLALKLGDQRSSVVHAVERKINHLLIRLSSSRYDSFPNANCVQCYGTGFANGWAGEDCSTCYATLAKVCSCPPMIPMRWCYERNLQIAQLTCDVHNRCEDAKG